MSLTSSDSPRLAESWQELAASHRELACWVGVLGTGPPRPRALRWATGLALAGSGLDAGAS